MPAINIKLISYKIQSFSNNEILNMIPVDVLNEIKQKDEHPFIQMYSIAHDGISNPKLLNKNNDLNYQNKKPVHWTRKAIQSIKNIVLKGIKLFKGHNADNSTENRESMGEIIHNEEREIEGKLHHIVYTYHPKEKVEEAKKLDVCSQEGFWNFIETAKDMFADTVESITGIALASSDNEIPAFSGAKRLGLVQCFADGMSAANSGGTPEKIIKEVTMEITKKDVIDFIQKNGLHIHEVGFTLEDAKKDRIIGKALEDYEKKIKEFTDKEIASQKDKEDFEKKVKEFTDKENLATAKTRFEELIKPLKNENEKIFIEKKFNIDNPTDLTDEGLKGFIEAKQNEYKLIEPLFKQGDTPIYQPDGKPPVADEEDMTKAANNPLLEEDFDPYQR